ncbi:MAG: putative ABC transporter permease [Lachnospiraceae bacterium]|nr:putative ABC transporter permease [Lachnospiraceae bacterium]
MIISRYFNYFIVFSFIGWLYECTYCTINTKHWQNRGFLFGPICPIYGTAVLCGIFLFGDLPQLLNMSGSGSGLMSFLTDLPWWGIFLVSMILSAIIEYVTSFLLEKRFHARWWDYSEMPLNINGRICLPASLGFGAAGVVIVEWILPIVMTERSNVHPLVTEGLSLGFMLIFGMDMAMTLASLSSMLDKLESMQNEFDRRMENGYQIASEGPAAIAEAAGNATQKAAEAAGAKAEKWRERAGSFVEGLTDSERYHVRNIRIYKGTKKALPHKMDPARLFSGVQERLSRIKIKGDDSEEKR